MGLRYLQKGRTSPGLFIIRRGASLADVLEFLIYAANADHDDQWLVITFSTFLE